MLDLLTFPLVTEKFCRDIIESAEKTEKWQTDRHKNYPTYDKELKTFGWGMIYQNIFDDVDEIDVKILHIHEDITGILCCEMELTVDGELLLVVDIFEFDGDDKIKSLRAYKGN